LSRGYGQSQRVRASAALPKVEIRLHADRRDRATTHEIMASWAIKHWEAFALNNGSEWEESSQPATAQLRGQRGNRRAQ
jgi:hypothetical protein